MEALVVVGVTLVAYSGHKAYKKRKKRTRARLNVEESRDSWLEFRNNMPAADFQERPMNCSLSHTSQHGDEFLPEYEMPPTYSEEVPANHMKHDEIVVPCSNRLRNEELEPKRTNRFAIQWKRRPRLAVS